MRRAGQHSIMAGSNLSLVLIAHGFRPSTSLEINNKVYNVIISQQDNLKSCRVKSYLGILNTEAFNSLNSAKWVQYPAGLSMVALESLNSNCSCVLTILHCGRVQRTPLNHANLVGAAYHVKAVRLTHLCSSGQNSSLAT